MRIPSQARRGSFDRARLPDPLSYYATELERLRPAGSNPPARIKPRPGFVPPITAAPPAPPPLRVDL